MQRYLVLIALLNIAVGFIGIGFYSEYREPMFLWFPPVNFISALAAYALWEMWYGSD